MSLNKPEFIKRMLDVNIDPGQSAFLWGIRQSGKSTYLRHEFPKSLYINLLDTDVFFDLQKTPSKLRKQILALDEATLKYPVIIDEIQKIPALLDEVHLMIESKKAYFILSASSARKLKKEAANLLGGRAWSFYMHPFVYPEIKDNFDLIKALNSGLLPAHYLTNNYDRALDAYVKNYLKEEIQAESLVRNLPSFSRFLDSFVYSNGELTNYANIARDCGIDAKTVKNYYQILVDTIMGYFVYPFSQSESRDTLSSVPKFYLADVGIASYLSQRTIKALKGNEAGKAFEHWIFLEILAYKQIKNKRFEIKFWRHKSNHEVDFIIENKQEPLYAIEVKIGDNIDKQDIKGLIEFQSRYPQAKAIVVCNEQRKRFIDEASSIMAVPYTEFLDELWAGTLF